MLTPVFELAQTYVNRYFAHLRAAPERGTVEISHFAHDGWAFVDFSADSNPAPNDDYYLLYDHPIPSIFSGGDALRFGVLASFSLRSDAHVLLYAPLRCSRKPRQNAKLGGRASSSVWA